MTVGPYAGRKVSEAKPLIKDEMIAGGHALAYSEPEKTVRRGTSWVKGAASVCVLRRHAPAYSEPEKTARRGHTCPPNRLVSPLSCCYPASPFRIAW